MWHVWGYRSDVYIVLGAGKLNERENLEEQCVGMKIMLKNDFKEIGWEIVDWLDLAQTILKK